LYDQSILDFASGHIWRGIDSGLRSEADLGVVLKTERASWVLLLAM
jgi:hypothetical protein